MDAHQSFMEQAINLARRGAAYKGGGAFGAVIVKDGNVVARAYNKVRAKNNCIHHAELAVIDKACLKLKSKELRGCILYTSCEPCMMCLGACAWANLDAIYYGASAEDAHQHGFIYSNSYFAMGKDKRHAEFNMHQLMRDEALEVWN